MVNVHRQSSHHSDYSQVLLSYSSVGGNVRYDGATIFSKIDLRSGLVGTIKYALNMEMN